MKRIKNGWLQGLRSAAFVTVLVLLPYLIMGKFEMSKLLVVMSMLVVGTLVFGAINKYYDGKSKKEKC